MQIYILKKWTLHFEISFWELFHGTVYLILYWKKYANNSDNTIKEIIMIFVEDVNVEKSNRHFYDDNDSRRYC